MTDANPAISPAVADILGAEQAARYRTEPHLRTGTCWECGDPVNADTEPVSVIVRVQDTSAGQRLPVARLAHAQCSPSDVRDITDAEIIAHADPDSLDGSSSVALAAMTWPPGTDTGRPVAFLSFGQEVTANTPTGDRTDLVVTWLLATGWELAARIGTPPAAAPPGWEISLGVDTLRCNITGPHPETGDSAVVANIHPLLPGRSWAEAAITGTPISLYCGPLGVEQWGVEPDVPAIQRAAKAGRLVGAQVPARIHRG